MALRVMHFFLKLRLVAAAISSSSGEQYLKRKMSRDSLVAQTSPGPYFIFAVEYL